MKLTIGVTVDLPQRMTSTTAPYLIMTHKTLYLKNSEDDRVLQRHAAQFAAEEILMMRVTGEHTADETSTRTFQAARRGSGPGGTYSFNTSITCLDFRSDGVVQVRYSNYGAPEVFHTQDVTT